MPKPRRQHQNRRDGRSRQPRYEYRVGDTVYFHAQPHKNKEEKSFICQGLVLRQPHRDSRVYKLVVVAVNPHSVMCGNQPELAKVLLGKKLPRGAPQLMKTPASGILSTAYDQTQWLEITVKEKEQILRKIGR